MASREVNISIPYGPERKPWSETVSKIARTRNGRGYFIKPPSENPIEKYPQSIMAPEKEPLYQVPSSGISDISTVETAKSLALERNQIFQGDFLGFQANQAFDYSDLNGFLKICTNNIGDPFSESSKRTNTRWIERNVLDYYASLWNIHWPQNNDQDDSYWGYCLTMGSTEGNMYAMWNARDYLTGKDIMLDVRPNCPTPYSLVQCKLKNGSDVLEPVAFYSYDTHYSLAKAVALLQISTFYQLHKLKYDNEPNPLSIKPNPLPNDPEDPWPEFVPTDEYGAIDQDALKVLVGFFAQRGHPIVVLFNYGTVFTGAYDDVKSAGQTVVDTIIEKSPDNSPCNTFIGPDEEGKPRPPFQRLKYWIHVDGALGASYMPFYRMGVEHGLITPPKDTHFPEFDFSLPFVSSIVSSSHKWIGAPWPCGVYLTRAKLMLKPPSKPGYIASSDTTFAGSRNALSPLLIWSHITTHDYETEAKRLNKCFEVVEYSIEKLKALEKKLKPKDDGYLLIKRSPLSLAVFFRKPNDKICKQFSISFDTYKGNRMAHIFVMEHVTKDLIDRFIAALESDDDPFPVDSSREEDVYKAPVYNKSCKRLMPWGFGGGGLF